MSNILTLTEQASIQLKKIIESAPNGTVGVVVGIDKSGCSGYSYKLDFANENEVEGNPWELDLMIAQMNGVITQSVTLASEAVILGLPTLLVSKAKRGFLDRLQEDGYPLFIARDYDESVLAAWLAGIHLLETLDIPNWPNTKSEILDLIKH